MIKIILIALCIFKAAHAEVDFFQSGEVGMNAVHTQKPSSQKNEFSFKMPEARLNLGISLEQDIQVQSELVFAKSRNPTNERWALQLERAYFDFDRLDDKEVFVQYGLIPLSWSDLLEDYWPYRASSQFAAPFAERYSYLNRSDLGIKLGGALQEWGDWSISVINGEGSSSDETGNKKDVELFLQSSMWEGFNWALLGVLGNYENIDSKVSQKERILLFLSYESLKNWIVFIELMSARDSSDGSNQKIADRVDFVNEGGQSLRSSGGSVGIRYRIREKSEFFVRYDALNPAIGIDAKGLKQTLLGFGFFPRQYLQFSLAWGHVQYEKDHASNVRDASEAVFSTLVKW